MTCSANCPYPYSHLRPIQLVLYVSVNKKQVQYRCCLSSSGTCRTSNIKRGSKALPRTCSTCIRQQAKGEHNPDKCKTRANTGLERTQLGAKRAKRGRTCSCNRSLLVYDSRVEAAAAAAALAADQRAARSIRLVTDCVQILSRLHEEPERRIADKNGMRKESYWGVGSGGNTGITKYWHIMT